MRRATRPGRRAVTEDASSEVPEEGTGNRRVAILLAMAMFVLVVDTSLMNVSISAVVEDLDTTVSGVQSAIALEALVSAAFILISSKIGDLFGRKRAYVLGLLGYAVGAIAMTLAQGLTAIIIFWAILGGLGASLLLPAMQSLIHGNFEGAAQKKVYALVGAAAAIAAAVGPLLGGFITTYLSWRVGFLLEAVIIAIVLSGVKQVRDVPYTGPRGVDAVGAIFSVFGMGGIVLGILVWQEGGEAVGALLVIGAASLSALAYWLVTRRRQGKLTLLDPDLFRSKPFRIGFTQQMMQQIALGGAMIALPIFLQMVLEYNAMQTGLSLAPLSLSMFGMTMLAAKKAGDRRPSSIIRMGFALLTIGMLALIPIVPRADSGWYFVVPLVVAGSGFGLLVSQLNNYTLAPISEERISEAAGVNSASGSFGLSFGLAFAGAVMLASLSFLFTSMAEDSTVLPPADQQQVAEVLEDDAELMSNTQLDQLLADEPEAIQDEIIRINTDARPRALQFALLVPILAGLIGLINSFRMMRMPEPVPKASIEGMTLGIVAGSAMTTPTPTDDALVAAVRELLVELGIAMSAAGDSVDAIDSSLRAIIAAYGVEHVEVAVLPTSLMVGTGHGTGTQIEIGIPRGTPLRFDQVAELYTLVRAASSASISPDEALEQLHAIYRMPPTFRWPVRTLGHAVMTVGLALLLQPTLGAVGAAFVLGLLVGLAKLPRLATLELVFPIVVTFVVSVIVFATLQHVQIDNPVRILIPPVVTFLPGCGVDHRHRRAGGRADGVGRQPARQRPRAAAPPRLRHPRRQCPVRPVGGGARRQPRQPARMVGAMARRRRVRRRDLLAPVGAGALAALDVGHHARRVRRPGGRCRRVRRSAERILRCPGDDAVGAVGGDR